MVLPTVLSLRSRFFPPRLEYVDLPSRHLSTRLEPPRLSAGYCSVKLGAFKGDRASSKMYATLSGAVRLSPLVKQLGSLIPPADLGQILGHPELVKREANRSFLLSSQFPIGGFGKEPEDYPDPYHSYLALAALALSHSSSREENLGLKELDPRWNVSVDMAEWFRREMARIKGDDIR